MALQRPVLGASGSAVATLYAMSASYLRPAPLDRSERASDEPGAVGAAAGTEQGHDTNALSCPAHGHAPCLWRKIVSSRIGRARAQ
jgi:hypothetical protein